MDIFEVNLIEVPDLFEVEIITGTSIIVNSNGTYNAVAYNGQTFVVPDTQWIDSDGTPMTTPATLPIVCTPPVTLGVDIVNSDLTLNDHANDGDTYVVADTIVKNTLGTTILTQPSATNTGVIADSVVTNSDATFSLNVPAETNPVLTNITHIDSDLTPVVLSAMTPMVCTPATTPEGWYPPADWGWDAASALINDGDNGFVAIVAVFPNIVHRLAFTPTFTGTASVDWGDGSAPETLTSGVKAQHEFDYFNISGLITTCGFKCAVVKMISTSYFTMVNFDVYHSSESSTIYNGMLALKMRAVYNGSTLFGYTNQQRNRDLFYIDAKIDHLNMPYAFYAHFSLKKIILPENPIYGLGPLFRAATIPYVDWNNFDWSKMTSLYLAFTGSYGYPYSLDISIPLVTSLGSSFGSGSSFRSIILRDTGLVSSISYALYESVTCKVFNMDDCSAVTDTSYFIYTGANYIENLTLSGLTVGINISNGKLSATALNDFMTALGTANGAQTITVTGNPGAATCDTSIATAKGFTVTV